MVMYNIDQLHFASKCVIINEENKFLILKRTNYANNETQDKWDFPGGSVNLDEDANDAIIREINEELQIELNEANVFKINSGKGIPSGQFVFVLFASRKHDLKDGIKLSKEHSEYQWISLDEIDNYTFYLRDNIIEDIKNYMKELE